MFGLHSISKLCSKRIQISNTKSFNSIDRSSIHNPIRSSHSKSCSISSIFHKSLLNNNPKWNSFDDISKPIIQKSFFSTSRTFLSSSSEKNSSSNLNNNSNESNSSKSKEEMEGKEMEEGITHPPGPKFILFSLVCGILLGLSLQDSPRNEWKRWLAPQYGDVNSPKQNEEELEPEDELKLLQLEESEQINWLAIKFFFRSIQLWIMAWPLIITSPVLYFFKKTIIEKMWWAALLWMLELAGPCWIKLGQWVSTRPDLFSDEFCAYLSKLHSNCPTHSFSKTKEIIESTFQKPLMEVFSYIDKKPIASGAIAQVHQATLINGQKVAVKVRHPHTRESVLTDLSIMSVAVKILNCLPGVEFLSLNDAKEQFRLNMLGQLNLAREANNLARFRRNFKGFKEVVFPKPYASLTSPTILVESFESGIPIAKFFDSPDIELKKKLADIGLNGYLKMMLVDQFVHADLHPGNVLVKNADPNEINDLSKEKVQLVLLDAGLVTQMTPEDSFKFLSLFKAVVQGDGPGGAEMMVKYAREPPKWATPTSEEEYLVEMGAHFLEIRKKKLSEIEVGQFLASLMGTVRKYGVKLEGNFSTLMLGTIVLEGLGRRLNPEINIIESSVPFIFKEGLWTDTFWDFLAEFFPFLKSKKENEG
eukprot:TRINITY_DN9369_c0_g1_i1.p1 TRINITY_DN9369_c0_g1~~TRINITY_DN9369_c0_g1_i1.p1  ORF type:complete len:647 (+),score=195.61 TRINITY_DN9369_c0_g1_i1:96-2036(+)